MKWMSTDEAKRRTIAAYYGGLAKAEREQDRVWLASWFWYYRTQLVQVLQRRLQMQDAEVQLKNGQTFKAPIWEWRPRDGWFGLVGHDTPIYLRDVASAVDRNQRTKLNVVEDVDLLARARREGWDGT